MAETQTEPSVTHTVEADLRAIASGARSPLDLEVQYDDMHGLHGGVTITLRGDGSIHAVRREPPSEPETQHQAVVSSADVLAVVQLLVELAVWRQDVAERTLLPDESLARLRVHVAGGATEIWEFYNDRQRLARVHAALSALLLGAEAAAP